MNLSHTCRELQRKVAATEMDIEQRGLHTAMSGGGCKLVYVPTRMGEVGQTEMAKSVCRESFDANSACNLEYDLGLTPYRDGFGVVTA